MFVVKALLLCLIALTVAFLLIFRPKQTRSAIHAFNRFARRRRLSVVAVTGLSLAIRLSLLPWMPIPKPGPHDEAGHLLIADTFASGRLTNPAHPFWKHFESIYVFHQPTYLAPYPPGQGAALALGQVLTGKPWFGVWLTAGLMCGAICWMLQGWLPANWALLGGLIAVMRLGVFDYWMNSYWGGAVAALGGALVFGSLARLWIKPRPLYGMLLGIGWSLIWFTRIYEALVLGTLIAVFLLVWIRRESGMALLPFGTRIIAPIAAVLSLAAAFTFYDNWRVTGDPLVVPNRLQQKIYGVPMAFYFQSAMPGGPFRIKAIQDNFEWQKREYMKRYSPRELIRAEIAMCARVWSFYAGFQFTPFLLLIPFVAIQNPRIRLLLGLCLVAFAASFLYPILQVHYLAPYTSMCFLFILVGMRFARKWRPFGVPVGAIAVLAAVPLAAMQNWKAPQEELLSARTLKFDVIRELERAGGKHLVFVRYAADHHFYNEWVYNRADIDASQIVWAREVDPESDAALVRYFADRKVWVIDADRPGARLLPYSNAAPANASLKKP